MSEIAEPEETRDFFAEGRSRKTELSQNKQHRWKIQHSNLSLCAPVYIVCAAFIYVQIAAGLTIT